MLDIPIGELARLPSGALVADLAAIDRNIARAVALVEGRGGRLRPHFKAHKSTRLLLRQLAAGGCVGVTVQTPAEAAVVAAAGIRGILVAAPVVDPLGLAALEALAPEHDLWVVVDARRHVELLDGVARRAGASIGVLIELDVGGGRCGIPFGAEALLDVAAACAATGSLRLMGVQAYEGHATLRDDPAVRDTLVRQVAGQARVELARLREAGHDCDVVSGGGTGTLAQSAALDAHTEIQAGSYVLLDSAYASIGVGFETAIGCVARCVSRRDPSAGVLDVGLKELTTDHGPPRAWGDGIRVLGLSDEHTRVALTPGTQLGIGDVVLLEPSHLDPTMNLHDAFYVWDARTGSMDRWPIDGRRSSPSLEAGSTRHAV